MTAGALFDIVESLIRFDRILYRTTLVLHQLYLKYGGPTKATTFYVAVFLTDKAQRSPAVHLLDWHSSSDHYPF